MDFVDRLLRALRENPLLIVAGSIAASYTIVQTLLEPIQHPIWRDIAQVVLMTALFIGIVQAYLGHAMPVWRHAKDRLNQNPYFYALRETWVSFFLTFFIVGSTSITFGFEPVRALADHLRLDKERPKYCIRIAAACRDCIQLHDINGRPTGPTCLKLDSAGLADDQLERWNKYRAFGATADCSGQTISKDITPWQLETCGTEFRP